MSFYTTFSSLSVALGDAASPWLQQGNLRACVRTHTHTHTHGYTLNHMERAWQICEYEKAVWKWQESRLIWQNYVFNSFV